MGINLRNLIGSVKLLFRKVPSHFYYKEEQE